MFEEIISRKFIKELPDKNPIFFNYKTKSRVFDLPDCDLHGYLASLIMEGRRSFKRSPSSEKLLILRTEKSDSVVVQLAKESDYEGCEGWQHRKVQSHFMARDNRTIAVEVPVWSEELDMSGFVDIIRYFPNEDKYFLLDFKPKAKSEKKAATQLYYLEKMFCERTKIDQEKVSCVYFDNFSAYRLN